MSRTKPILTRREALFSSIALVTGIGLGPFVYQWYKPAKQVDLPDPAAQSAAVMSSIRMDLSGLGPGELTTAVWQDKPVFALRRDGAMLRDIDNMSDFLKDPYRDDESNDQPNSRNNHRSSNIEYLIVIGQCTHSDCDLEYRPDHMFTDIPINPTPKGGFFCTCDSSVYDLAGRVLKGDSPAELNLEVPPYFYTSEHGVIVGTHGFPEFIPPHLMLESEWESHKKWMEFK